MIRLVSVLALAVLAIACACGVLLYYRRPLRLDEDKLGESLAAFRSHNDPVVCQNMPTKAEIDEDNQREKLKWDLLNEQQRLSNDQLKLSNARLEDEIAGLRGRQSHKEEAAGSLIEADELYLRSIEGSIELLPERVQRPLDESSYISCEAKGKIFGGISTSIHYQFWGKSLASIEVYPDHVEKTEMQALEASFCKQNGNPQQHGTLLIWKRGHERAFIASSGKLTLISDKHSPPAHWGGY